MRCNQLVTLIPFLERGEQINLSFLSLNLDCVFPGNIDRAYVFLENLDPSRVKEDVTVIEGRVKAKSHVSQIQFTCHDSTSSVITHELFDIELIFSHFYVFFPNHPLLDAVIELGFKSSWAYKLLLIPLDGRMDSLS